MGEGRKNPGSKAIYKDVAMAIESNCLKFNNLVSAVKVYLPKTAAKWLRLRNLKCEDEWFLTTWLCNLLLVYS